MKLEEIHRNLAVLSIHWESRFRGPGGASGRQRAKMGIGRLDDF